jgi:hypothetical protein
VKLTTHLVIKKEESKYKDELGRPYFLYCADPHSPGPIGDKMDFGPGKSGKPFPREATLRFATFREAARAYKKFLAYVEDRKGHSENKGTPPNKDLDEKLTRGREFSCKLWE